MKTELESIINDLEFTVKSQRNIKKQYEDSLKKRPEQTQWLKVIGRAEGYIKMGEQVFKKLNEIVGG